MPKDKNISIKYPFSALLVRNSVDRLLEGRAPRFPRGEHIENILEMLDSSSEFSKEHNNVHKAGAYGMLLIDSLGRGGVQVRDYREVIDMIRICKELIEDWPLLSQENKRYYKVMHRFLNGLYELSNENRRRIAKDEKLTQYSFME